ncbi:unnamed protein product [Cercospora beticola]|nr:unnamed protein product [Cercospora beticola]
MATHEKIEEVKERLSFFCDEMTIRVILNTGGGDVNRTVSHLEKRTAQHRSQVWDLSKSHWFLGDKPAKPATECLEPVKASGPSCFISSGDTIVSIHVGATAENPSPSLKIFNVHQGVLCKSSEFFRSKVKPEWSRGKAEVELPHISAAAFAVYVNWLYFDKIMPNGKKLWERGNAADSSDWLTSAEAIALGDELMDSAFQHSAMDMMMVAARAENTGQMLSGQVVQIIYDGTPEDSGARSLIVDIFKQHPELLESCGDELPSAFLRTLALESIRKSEGLEERLSKNKCWYHKHGNGEACYSTTPALPGVAALLR